jgi:2-polyprenyl-3-methyl-5-hydroxy-6-metoxy-1,4-benzoquinol methylase
MLYRHVSANAPILLEVGCGCGEFLVEAQRRGFEVSGIEISSYAAETANHRLGMERVTVGTLGGVYLPETTFDVVVFADVIEHVRDPLEFLRRVYTLLKPGGIVFLVTPSLDSWSARLLGHRWMEYKVEHLFYFSKSTIQLALEKANFVRVTTLPNVKVLSVDYVYHHFRRFPVSLLTSWVALVRKLIPERFAHRHVRLVASGLVAIANKPQ